MDRGEILRHIGMLADKLERAPTRSEFIAETGISQCQIDNHFLSWREAVRAAGWQPKTEAQRIEDETLLQGWGDLARKLGHIPSVSEYEQQGRHHRTTIEKRFKCAFSMVHTKFREFAEGRPEWADVVAILRGNSNSQPVEDEALLRDWGELARKLGHIPTVSQYRCQGQLARGTIPAQFRSWSKIPAKFRAFAEGRPEWGDVIALLPADLTSRRIEDETLLRDWGEVVRKLREIPTVAQYKRQTRFSRRTMEARFGPWSKIPAKFRAFAESRPEWADVVALLPTVVRDRRQAPRAPVNVSPRTSAPPRHSKLSDRPVYGNPIDFRGLRHEPVNEDGVIFLFGMVARELGYLVEAVQAGFPDCEANFTNRSTSDGSTGSPRRPCSVERAPNSFPK